MKKTPAIIIAAAAFVASEASHANAKDTRMEIRRAITVKEARQGRGTDDAVTATPDTRQGRGTDDAVTATPDTRQGRGTDDAVTTTPDTRQGRGTDDAVTATPDTRQGRGADDTVAPVVAEERGIVSTFVNFVSSALGFRDSATAASAEVRQGRGADDAAINADGTPHIRQSRGADDAAFNADGTPHIRQSRGADDAAFNADGTPHIRQSRGADDAAFNADGTPHIRQSRGADDVVMPASGALVPAAAAFSASSQNTTQLRVRENQAVFGVSQQASETAGLAPRAVFRSNGKRHILDVIVAGYGSQASAGTADLENGEIIGNLPDKQRLRFAVYANAQQALAAASLWATPDAQTTRADSALVAAETGIITWDAETGRPDDDGSDGKGSINGLFLSSERMPELSSTYLQGKVIQIYGPLVTVRDDAGNPISSTRLVYWSSAPLR